MRVILLYIHNFTQIQNFIVHVEIAHWRLTYNMAVLMVAIHTLN